MAADAAEGGRRCWRLPPVALLTGVAIAAAFAWAPASALEKPDRIQAEHPVAPLRMPAANSGIAERGLVVTGFRSARFGMTETELRAAIARDFKTAAGKLRVAANPRDGTTSLIAETRDLLPGAGRSAVVYILGHSTQRLIQVNVLWGAPLESGRSPRMLAATAEPLRAHLLQQGYKKLSVVVDALQPDGRVVLFQGRDSKGALTSLTLVPAPKGLHDGQPQPDAKGAGLHLAYVSNPDTPDIKR